MLHEVWGSHPEWETGISEIMDEALSGVTDRAELFHRMNLLCVTYLRGQTHSDLGALQRYLRVRSAAVQLTARQFRPDELEEPGVLCIDIITGKPKGHWLSVEVGYDEIEEVFATLGVSHEVNETILSRDTGMLARPRTDI